MMFTVLYNNKNGDYDVSCKVGLNIDSNCELWFVEFKNLCKYLTDSCKIAYVSLIDGVNIYENADDGKFNVPSFIIDKIVPIYMFEFWHDDDFCMLAVKQSPILIEFVNDQTEKMCLEAVKQDESVVAYVREQTEEMCLIAVKRNGYLINELGVITEAVYLAAVAQDGLVIKHIDVQTEAICLAAIKQNIGAFDYIDENYRTSAVRSAAGIKN